MYLAKKTMKKISRNISFMTEVLFPKFYLNQSIFFARNKKVEKIFDSREGK